MLDAYITAWCNLDLNGQIPALLAVYSDFEWRLFLLGHRWQGHVQYLLDEDIANIPLSIARFFVLFTNRAFKLADSFFQPEPLAQFGENGGIDGGLCMLIFQLEVAY